MMTSEPLHLIHFGSCYNSMKNVMHVYSRDKQESMSLKTALALGYVSEAFKLAVQSRSFSSFQTTVPEAPYKKPQLNLGDLANFTLISHLPFLSKILEKGKLCTFLQKKQNFRANQSTVV